MTLNSFVFWEIDQNEVGFDEHKNKYLAMGSEKST